MNLFRKGQASELPASGIVHLKLAGTLGLIGKFDEAKVSSRGNGQTKPENELSGTHSRSYILYRNARFQTFHDKTIIQGLRNIGFPEELAAQ